MTWIKKTVTALGLVGLLSACGTPVPAQSPRSIQIDHMRYSMQDNGIAIPDLDWPLYGRRAQRYAQGALPNNMSVYGLLLENATPSLEGNNHFDYVIQTRNASYMVPPRMVRITIDYIIVASDNEGDVGTRVRRQVIARDQDSDGFLDRMWDDRAGSDDGGDGIYEMTRPIHERLNPFINRIVNE